MCRMYKCLQPQTTLVLVCFIKITHKDTKKIPYAVVGTMMFQFVCACMCEGECVYVHVYQVFTGP